MSDNELFEEVEENVEEEKIIKNTEEPNVVIEVKDFSNEEDLKPKVKQKKPRKKIVMTPERKEQLLKNLAKGRETAKKNRMKTAKYKKLMKDKERQKVDEVLEEDYKVRTNKINYKLENEKLLEKIKLLETIKEEKEEVKHTEKITPKLIEVVETPIIIEPHKPKIIKGGRNGGSMWSKFK